MTVETNKLQSNHLQQMPKLKRVNSLPFSTVLNEILNRENRSNAIVGGGAESGLGPGHLTTLTSFNISAIHNLAVESPANMPQSCEKDMNALE